MKLRIVCALLVATAVLSGCYEDEMKIKRWAEGQSAEYFRDLIRKDVHARVSKLAVEGIPQLSEEFRRINQRSASELRDHLGNIGTFPSESSQDIESITSLHRGWVDEYLSRGPRLLELQRQIGDLNQRVQALNQVCNDYFEHYAPPPVDIASIAATLGESGFEFYLSISFSASDSSGASNPSLRYEPGDNFVESVVNRFNEFVGDLFSSEEEKNALDDARRIISESYPKSDERKKLVQNQCRMSFRDANTLLIEYLESLTETKAMLTQVYDRLTEKPIRALGRLNATLLDANVRLLDEAWQRRSENETRYRRGDQVTAYLAQIRGQFVESRKAVMNHDCVSALSAYHSGRGALELLKSYLDADDAQGYHNSLRYFESQAAQVSRLLVRAGGCSDV